MRLLIIGGQIARQRWLPGRRVVEIATALRARGHAVTLAAESIDDDAPLRAAGVGVLAFTEFRQHKEVRALGFGRWARRVLDDVERDAAISCTWGAPAEVWFPLDASGGAWLAGVRRRAGRAGMAKAALKHWESVAHAAGDRLARADPSRVHHVLASGAAAGERMAGSAVGAVRRCVRDIGFASSACAVDGAEGAWLRARTRGALGVSEGKRLVAVSVSGAAGGGRPLDALIGGLAGLLASEPARAPALVFMAREGFGVHAALERAAAERAIPGEAERLRAHVRIAGLTERVERVLAACDAAAAPEPGLGMVGAAEHGRFIADALRVGRPVLAAAGASGAELLGAVAERGERPGMLLREARAGEWRRALAAVSDEVWVCAAGAEAARVGAALGLDGPGGLVDRLEAMVR